MDDETKGHVAHETLVEKSEKNKPFNRPKNRRNIKVNLKAGLLRIIMSDVSLLRSLREFGYRKM